MSELELVWVRECEICGKEHQRNECLEIGSLDDIESESGAFKFRCENWYPLHIRALRAEQGTCSTLVAAL
ncbi:MAG: hypothetical protein ACI915_000778 [Gammaproteobacteria bacterium]|jgi:hypothetical protein